MIKSLKKNLGGVYIERIRNQKNYEKKRRNL